MRKKIAAVAISAVMVFACLGLGGCAGANEQGKQLIVDIQLGLQERWDKTDVESDTIKDLTAAYGSGVDCELSKLEAYEGVNLGNEELRGIVDEYVTALESQKEGLKYLTTDAEKYNELWYVNGYDKRRECVKKLVDDYGLTVDEKYDDKLEGLTDGPTYRAFGLGDTIDLNIPDYGEVKVSIDGFMMDKNYEGEAFGRMLLKLENISYDDEWNPGFVSIDQFIRVLDGTGMTIDPSSSCGDYKNYSPAAGAYAECSQGQKRRLCIEYLQDIKISYAQIMMTDGETVYSCYTPVK